MKSVLMRLWALVLISGVSACAASPSMPSGGSLSGAAAPAVASASHSVSAQVIPDATAIQSSCGQHIRVEVGGVVLCHFTQQGYDGQFSVANDAQGIVDVTPSQGTKKTPFRVTALLVGSGYLYVTDTTGHHLKVHVRVKPIL